MKKLYTSFLFLTLGVSVIAQEFYTSPLWGEQGHREYVTWSGAGAGFDGALTDDGKLLVAGSGYWNGCNCMRMTMAKVDTACGALDPTFGSNGTTAIQFEGRSMLYDLEVQADGKILGCGITAPGNGFSGHKSAVYRLMPDGSPDTTFNGTGHHKVPFQSTSSGCFFRVFPTASGGVVCVGSTTSNINGGINSLGAARFNADGTLDPTFSGDGLTHLNIATEGYTHDWDLGSGVMLADSSFLVVAVVIQGGVQTIGMLKVLNDGTIDTSFGTNGLNVSPVAIASDVSPGGMNAILNADGKILVSGTSDFGAGDWFVARFHSNGDVDSSYAVNGISTHNLGANSLGRRLELLPDGSTIQYGSANWNDGHARMVKRLADGSLDMNFGGNGIAAPGTPQYVKVYGGMTMPNGKIMAWGHWNELSIMRFTSDPASEGIIDLDDEHIGCGDSTMLDAGPGFVSYVWSNNDSTQTTYAYSDGDYIVHVTDANECADSDTVTVSMFPIPDQPVITSGDGILLETSATGDLQWYLNGVAIPGATAHIHEADANGDYTVEVVDANGCSNVSDPFQVVSIGIAETELTTWQIYPNPATDALRIQTDLIGNIEVSVRTIDGRLLKSVQTSERILTLNDLPKGLLILEIQAEDRRFHTPFIKN